MTSKIGKEIWFRIRDNIGAIIQIPRIMNKKENNGVLLHGMCIKNTKLKLPAGNMYSLAPDEDPTSQPSP